MAATALFLMLLAGAGARLLVAAGVVNTSTVDSFTADSIAPVALAATTGDHYYGVNPHQHVLLRKAGAAGTWEVFAGTPGDAGFLDGPGRIALFDHPASLCITPNGLLLVADVHNACVRAVDRDTGVVSTYAGRCGSPGFRDGAANDALFSDGLSSVSCLDDCSVLVSDLSNHRLRLLAPPSGAACPLPPHRRGGGGKEQARWYSFAWALGGAVAAGLVGLLVKGAGTMSSMVTARIEQMRAHHAQPRTPSAQQALLASIVEGVNVSAQQDEAEAATSDDDVDERPLIEF